MTQEITVKQTIGQYLSSPAVQKSITGVLGSRANQFTASVASLVGSNPKLDECTRQSLFSACLTAAALNLPINQNLGFAYIIPFNNRKEGVVEAQFQMGYKGFIQLAQRSGQIKLINVRDVREGEIADENFVTGEMVFKKADDREKLKVVGYLGYLELTSGFRKQLYINVADLIKHSTKYSQTAKSGYGLWKTDFDAMAAKTVIKKLLSKYAPMSADLEKAITHDQAVIDIDSDKITYPDNERLSAPELAQQTERERVVAHIENAKSIEELEKCKDVINPETDSEVFEQYMCKKELLEKEVKNA
jgi:recombination protein RecT